MKRYILPLIFALLSFMIFSCGDTPESEPTYRVMVSLDEGATVNGENPKTVKQGEDAVFEIILDEGYLYESVSGGEYDQTTGTLTVKNITSNTNIDFYTEPKAADGEGLAVYVFKPGSSLDTTDIDPGRNIPDTTVVTVKANDTDRNFIGWFISGKDGPVSQERSFSFRLSDYKNDRGVVTLFSRYLDLTSLYYDANGGEISTSTVNTSKSVYYSTKLENGKLLVTYTSEYLSYIECASTFYDDGTFRREGYILKEYNTKKDGTGTGYSLGSKFPLNTEGTTYPTLYCIWSEESPEDAFVYTDIKLALPDGFSAQKAPHWVEDGITITEYCGNDTRVTIPEKIGDKYVTAISANAFKNKDIEELCMGRYILKIEDGAFVGCDSLKSIYYPDGIYYISDSAFDTDSRASLTKLYVNATTAPRYVSSATGAFSVKLSRILSSEGTPRVIVLGGSSVYQGLSTEYMEALLDSEYRVINFGTTRTTNGIMYLEALASLANEDDIILYAPENSSYMMGECELYYKTLRDLESMNNIYRHVDISRYTAVFSSFADFNQNYKYKSSPKRYEDICKCIPENPLTEATKTDKYGDIQQLSRLTYCQDEKYHDSYTVTMNERFKSRHDLHWADEGQKDHTDYTDLTDTTWCSITDEYFTKPMNEVIDLVKANTGAKVYFSFSPVDRNSLVEGATSSAWLSEYDRIFTESFAFDGVLGSSADYIYDHRYMFDCAFHLNDYGRAYRTYRLYLDLADELDITEKHGFTELGTDFSGCLFEIGSTGTPLYPFIPE